MQCQFKFKKYLSNAVALLSWAIIFKVFNEEQHIFMEYAFNYHITSKWNSQNTGRRM